MNDINPEEYQYVLAMDPGGTTGIAMMRYTETTAPELIWLSQLEGGQAGFFQFFEGTMPAENVTVVSESFTLREGVHGADVTPLRIEGIQYALWGDDVVYQEPSMKKLIPDSFLKEQNLWTPGHRHQMDALIHALVYLRNQMHEPTLDALSGNSDEKLATEGEAKSKTLDFQRGVDQEQVEQIMEAVNKLYGGAEPEREEPELSEGPGSGDDGEESDDEGDGEGGQGEAGDEEGEGGPSGSGGRGKEFEVEEPEVQGERRRRVRNGAFSGFDDE